MLDQTNPATPMADETGLTEASRPVLPRHARLHYDKVRGAWVLLVPERVLVPDETAVEILQLGQASTPDGIAVDVDGMVYVAANIPGQIWRVDGAADSLQRGELVAEGVASVASLAFGNGPGFDPCSLYVTQLFGSQVIRVGVGVPGAL